MWTWRLVTLLGKRNKTREGFWSRLQPSIATLDKAATTIHNPKQTANVHACLAREIYHDRITWSKTTREIEMSAILSLALACLHVIDSSRYISFND